MELASEKENLGFFQIHFLNNTNHWQCIQTFTGD